MCRSSLPAARILVNYQRQFTNILPTQAPSASTKSLDNINIYRYIFISASLFKCDRYWFIMRPGALADLIPAEGHSATIVIVFADVFSNFL
jgi:hypothetical protein